MSVCVLNDVGATKHLLSKSPEFETPLVTPWLDWDTRIEAILNSYISDDEFSFVGFDEILWEIVNHFTTQEKPSANILDGNIFVTMFAVEQYCNQRLSGYPIHSDIEKLFVVIKKTIQVWFHNPNECVNVLVQTGEDTDTFKIFTYARFFMWFNENDLSENFVFNTAIEFSEFEKDFIRQLPKSQKQKLYPNLLPISTPAPASSTISFF